MTEQSARRAGAGVLWLLVGACSVEPGPSGFGADATGYAGDETSSHASTSGAGPADATGPGDGTTAGDDADGTTGDATQGAQDDGDPIKLDVASMTDVALPTVECSDTIIARVRDLPPDFPDLNQIGDPDCSLAKPGLVQPTLNAEGNPAFASAGPGPQLTTAANFDQWYRDVPGVNIGFDVPLELVVQGDTQVYASNNFFPIDGAGYGNNFNGHNYYFTTEVRMLFEYEPGQVFTFEGDDDFWLFIEDQLVIDLGGLHCELSETIAMDDWADALGLTAGGVYEMAIFHAERGVFNSNFTLQTNIACLGSPPQ